MNTGRSNVCMPYVRKYRPIFTNNPNAEFICSFVFLFNFGRCVFVGYCGIDFTGRNVVQTHFWSP